MDTSMNATQRYETIAWIFDKLGIELSATAIERDIQRTKNQLKALNSSKLD